MKKIVTILTLLLLFVNGCTTKSSPPTLAPTQLTLSFETNPTKPVPNQPVTLMAKVTGNHKPVNNANIEFEVWKTGAKKHQMIKANRTADGIYTTTNTYPASGIYNVIIHATTPQVHQMISKTFTIGQVTEGQHHHHQGIAGVQLHLQLPATAKSGQETKLLGHVMQDNKPFTGANVEYEIWKEGDKNHDYTDVAEINPGEYYSTYHFKTPGTYHVKMHVEKGKVHEHTEQLLVVK